MKIHHYNMSGALEQQMQTCFVNYEFMLRLMYDFILKLFTVLFLLVHLI
jgi:hypothetical protein